MNKRRKFALVAFAGAGLTFFVASHNHGVIRNSWFEALKPRDARFKTIQVTTSRGKLQLYPSARSAGKPALAQFGPADQADARLFDDSPVILLTNRTEARAYPILFLNIQEIIFDNFNGEPVLITYCGLTDSPAVYKCDNGLTPNDFIDSERILESNLVMRDTKTHSLWTQLGGTCFSGPMAGKKLWVVPSCLATLGSARDHFSNLKVMRPPPSFLSNEISRASTTSRSMRAMQRSGPDYPLSDFDPALPLRERVLGVALDGLTIAIPLSNGPSTNHFGSTVVRTRIGLGFPMAERLARDGEWEVVAGQYCYWFAWYLAHRDTIVVPRAVPGLTALDTADPLRPNQN